MECAGGPRYLPGLKLSRPLDAAPEIWYDRQQQMANTRLRNLYQRDPHCSICGRMTFMPKDIAELFDVAPENMLDWHRKIPAGCLKRMATKDHIYPMADYRRHLPKATYNEERTRLACKGCNETRGAKIIGGPQYARKLPALGVLLEVI